ncbi:MAG TPA: Nif3-like dinuclear metal center hexameric protein [Gemmatimonadaceae bacterium]|nr:Nif3-like dinuclear metal center hexameric protein [Gemmatimonadaceae bacterium]
MSSCSLPDLAAYLDERLRVRETPDYPPALNGVQLAHRGPVHRIAAAVDVSRRTIEGAITAGANLLLVHHGMFWGGLERIDGRQYDRMRLLMDHDVAVYSAHLPLDTHPEHGNSRLLAAHLGLVPSGGFARFENIDCGVHGESSIATADLQQRLQSFAESHGGNVVAVSYAPDRVTRRWAICSGSGASRDTLREADAAGIDTLIVGEGPHWTAVHAQDTGLVIMYAGHYATETLGVCSLAAHIESRFGLPWTFIPAPTGL